MSTTITGYYSYDENQSLTCPACGWSGVAGDGAVECRDELFDVSCPHCARLLLVVSAPTADETRQAAEHGDARAQEQLQLDEARASFLREFEERKLKSPDQLPDLNGDRLEFVWDFVSGERLTTIRVGERKVWAEPALWGARERFEEVRSLLEQRYDGRFVGLTPTAQSEVWLRGD